MVRFRLVEIVLLGQLVEQERLQAHRAGHRAATAAYAVGLATVLGLVQGHQEDARSAFDAREICDRHRLAHHRAAVDDVGDAFGQTASGLDEEVGGRAETHTEIAWLLDRLARHGDDALNQGLVLLDGLVNGVGRCHIDHDATRLDGQFARRHFATRNGLNQLFFTALRVLGLQGLHLNAFVKVAVRVDGLVEQLDGFHLVFLDADDALVGVDGLHQDFHADEEFLCFLQKQTEVAGEVRLTFGGINNNVFGFLAFGNHQFDVGGEGGAAHADDATFFHLVDDLLGIQFDVGNQFIGVDVALDPFVLVFAVDEDGGLVVACVVHHDIDFGDGARGGRVDIGRDESFGRADELSRQHAVAFLDDAFSRCAKALSERDDDLFGHREVLYGLMRREFVLFRMHAASWESL